MFDKLKSMSCGSSTLVERVLTEILKVAVQDQPVGTLAVEEELEKKKRLLIVTRNVKIVSDDGQLVV